MSGRLQAPPQTESRKVCVAATPPRPARVCLMVEGTHTVDQDPHKVPNTHGGKLRCWIIKRTENIALKIVCVWIFSTIEQIY